MTARLWKNRHRCLSQHCRVTNAKHTIECITYPMELPHSELFILISDCALIAGQTAHPSSLTSMSTYRAFSASLVRLPGSATRTMRVAAGPALTNASSSSAASCCLIPMSAIECFLASNDRFCARCDLLEAACSSSAASCGRILIRNSAIEHVLLHLPQGPTHPHPLLPVAAAF